jgi:hypothetical protein
VPKDNSPEAKAAKAFFSVLNVLSFDPGVFAVLFMNQDFAVQRRVIECLVEIVDLSSFYLDEGFYNTEAEIEFGMAAKRAQDAMEAFRNHGMLP